MAYHHLAGKIFPSEMMKKEHYSFDQRMQRIKKAKDLIAFIENVMMDRTSVKEYLVKSLRKNVETIHRLFLDDEAEEETAR